MNSPSMGGSPPGAGSRRPMVMLGMATLGFAVNFWAWALLSPLGTRYKDLLNLSGSQQALLVAVPVIVGSLGRIPVGALTDRFGGRVMFPLVSVSTIVPVLFIGLAGQRSFVALLIGGFFLGVGGTVFAVGVPFVNAWFPPERRGLALGVFGVGMGGTAISALTTVKLVTARGSAAPFLITAVALALYAALARLLVRDAPGRTVPTEPLGARLGAAARLTITWQACILYAVAFGGYVAFSVYLPTYLKTAYGLSQADAANRMAGFVILAVVMRPVGGWLSDRLGPIPGFDGCLCGADGGCRSAVLHPRSHAGGHDRLPDDGGCAGSRQWCNLCPRGPGGAGQQGRVRHRAGRRCRRPGRVRPAAGDGFHPRQIRFVRLGSGALGPCGCLDHGVHHDRCPVRWGPTCG